MTKYCPYCGVECKIIEGKKYCPNHGFIEEDSEELNDSPPSYIG